MQKWSLRIHADVISERRGVLPSILGTREIEIVLNIVLLCGVFLFVVVVFVFFLIVSFHLYYCALAGLFISSP